MRLIRGLTNLKHLSGQDSSPLANGCVATIGNFDGVHRGHQAIIEQVVRKSRALGVPSVVTIFEPQPREYFQGREAPPRLTAFRQKFEALLAAGIDMVLCIRFNGQFRSYTAMGFIDDVLLNGLGVRHLVVGDDFRFGCDRAGDFSLLSAVGSKEGFSVENTSTVTVGGERVSSSRIRECLADGRLREAEQLLGHPYRIRGRVVYGRQLGRKLDAPTANVLLAQMPALEGVYVVACTLASGQILDGVANIGLRPTVDGKQPSLEVHLLNFSGSLYGQHIETVFRHRLRGEIRFDSIDDLKAQIARDFDHGRAWIAAHGSMESQALNDTTN
jgi:riboflavin kinase/FMN adenylyltransferase